MDDGNYAIDVVQNGKSKDIFEEETATILKELADEVFPMFKVTDDIPSRYLDIKMSILDLKVWFDDHDLIRHEFFRKAVSYKGVLRSNSALPKSIMTSIQVIDGLRRALNCSPDLPWVEKATFLTELAIFMKQEGHGQDFRQRKENLYPDSQSCIFNANCSIFHTKTTKENLYPDSQSCIVIYFYYVPASWL